MAAAYAVTSRTPLASTQPLAFTPHTTADEWSRTLEADDSRAALPVVPAGQLPPMLRRLVSRARLTGRPDSASGPLTSTREMKLATTQQQLLEQQRRAQEHAHAQQQRQRRLNQQLQAQQQSHKAHTGDITARPESASSSRPVSARFQRDLGPLYSRFQAAAQQAQADLASPHFPGAISTSFERTSYWKRAPPPRSDQLGTLGLLFLHYAMPSPAAAVAACAAGPQQLDDADLPRLSFRSLLFLCTDWKVTPQLTTKARLAEAYHRFGGVQPATKGAGAASGARLDVGLSYASFVRCMACVALEARIPAPTLAPPGSGSHPFASPLAQHANQTARDRVASFMRHVQWSNLEAVAAGLDALEKSSWFRLRQELPQAKSCFVHKPTCLFKERRRVQGGTTRAAGEESISCVCAVTKPCAHASAPQWAPLAAQVVAGVHDRSAVLHLDPHGHGPHPLALGRTHAGKGAKGARPGASLSSLHSQEEKAAAASPAPPRRSTASSASARSSPSSAGAGSGAGSGAAHSELSRDESRAYNALRVFDRLPLESSWCAYPGAYIDMGVIEVLPSLASDPAPASSSSRAARDPSELVAAPLRPHRYTITLQNRAPAALKVSVSSVDCEWLGLQYDPEGFLALGMKQRLHILAPTRMPHDARPSGGVRHQASASSDSGAAGAAGAGAPRGGAGMGAGVERLGCVTLHVQNTWTYQCARVSIPVYARLVLQGSSDQLATLPTFKPSPSAPDLLLPLRLRPDEQQHDRVPRIQQASSAASQALLHDQASFDIEPSRGHGGGVGAAWSVNDEEEEDEA